MVREIPEIPSGSLWVHVVILNGVITDVGKQMLMHDIIAHAVIMI